MEGGGIRKANTKHTIKISSTYDRTYVFYSCENWTPTRGHRVYTSGVRWEVMNMVIGAHWQVTNVWPPTKVPDVSKGHTAGNTLLNLTFV